MNTTSFNHSAPQSAPFAWTGYVYLSVRNLLLSAKASRKKPPPIARIVVPGFSGVMITWKASDKPRITPAAIAPRHGYSVVTTPPFPNVYILLRIGNTCAAVFECEDGAVIKIPGKGEYYRVSQENVEPITETAYERSLRNGR